MPTEPETLQASHEPEQAVLQQTPSAQLPLRHSLDVEQALPFVNDAMHKLPTQWCPAAHPASFEQLDGHDGLAPPHTNGEHDGLPEVPVGLLVQVPIDPDTLQASQALPQAVLQQTPSMQLPLVH